MAFEIEIINPERVVFKGTAKSLVLPAFEGSMGVLTGHAHMVVQLVPGEVKVEPENLSGAVAQSRPGAGYGKAVPHSGAGREVYFKISGGFAEISQKRTRLFVDSIKENLK